MLILLTGGAACGKSEFGEKLCMQRPLPRYYIATMRPCGEDSQAKIKRHRKMRKSKHFETIEQYTDIENVVFPKRGTALLECICNLTANEMFDETGHFCDPCERIVRGVLQLNERCDCLIVITNDVGSDMMPAEAGTKAYISTVGRINAALSRVADEAYELVCGIPLKRKG